MTTISLSSVAAALNGRGFRAEVCSDKAAAMARLRELCAGASVGLGGSRTLTDMNAYDNLAGVAAQVSSHAHAPGMETMMAANRADVYITSANGLSADGAIVNIDGTGNRVGSTLIGPGKLVYVIGRNKIMPSVEAAVGRVYAVAAPLNAMRFKAQVPCTEEGGSCEREACPIDKTLCGQMVVIWRPSRMIAGGTHVLLVDEDVGF